MALFVIEEAPIEQALNRLWQGQWRQALDFAELCIVQLRWLAIKHGFIQRISIQACGLTYSYNLCHNE